MKIISEISNKAIVGCIWELSELSPALREIELKKSNPELVGSPTLAEVLMSNKNIELSPALRQIEEDGVIKRLDIPYNCNSDTIFIFNDGSAIVESSTRFTAAQF